MTWSVGWRYRRTALLVGVLSFMSIHVARLTISPLVPSIVDSFDVSYGSIGLVFTGISVTYALTQFPSGLLGDRLGERLVVLTSLGLTAGCSVLLALSPSYPFFLAVVGSFVAQATVGFLPAFLVDHAGSRSSGPDWRSPPCSPSRHWPSRCLAGSPIGSLATR